MEFKLPEIGENIESADVVRIMVHEGDTIAANTGVVELETEKAIVELPCPHAGKVAKIHVTKGQTIKVGQVLLTIEDGATVSRDPPPSPPAAAPLSRDPKESAPAIPTPQPTVPPSAAAPPPAFSREPQASNGTVPFSLARKSGQSPEPQSPLPAGPETRRLARELGVDLARVRGTGVRGRITPEDVRAAASGAAFVQPARTLSTIAPPHPSPLPEGEGTVEMPPEDLGFAPEAAEMDGASMRLEVDAFSPAFPHPSPLPAGEGTIETPPDAIAIPPDAIAIPPEAAAVASEPNHDAFGPARRERMSRIRRTIAAQMVKSARTIPHVTNFDDADVTDLENLRKTVPESYLGPAVKLTALAFVIKSVALALREHPMVNSSLDDETEEIIYKEYVNVGVAVDTPRGLVVPVLRNADQLGMPQIAQELAALATKARAAEFALEDLRGGTFTVSNLGAVGGAYSTPIINHPEVAILLLGRSRWRVAMTDDKIERRLMMPLSLSFDHRVVDGAAAGRFLNSVIDYLQTPGKLLLTT
jgi:pyruvate dehydrogenase E2 component (dihydrolipoamide acetyltransferase)